MEKELAILFKKYIKEDHYEYSCNDTRICNRGLCKTRDFVQDQSLSEFETGAYYL